LGISKYFLLGSFNNLRTEYSVSSHYLAAPWRVSSIPPVSRPPHGQYPVSSILQLGPKPRGGHSHLGRRDAPRFKGVKSQLPAGGIFFLTVPAHSFVNV